MQAIITGKWTVGYSHNPEGFTLLRFDFTDREAIILAIPPEAADGIAKAILENLTNPPPRPDRRN